MNFTKFAISSCCGKTSIIYKIDEPITTKHLDSFIKLGFNEHKNFTAAGIMYVTSKDFIITSPIGSNRVQLKMIGNDIKINDFEALLKQI